MTRVRIETPGGLRIEPSEFTRPKPLLLLAYLALEGSQQRRTVAELFWPNGNRMKSLSMALSRLRLAVPEAITEADGRIATCVGCDASELLADLDDDDLEAATSLYRGAFLDGVDLDGHSAELEDWVFATREYLAERVQLALVSLAERADARGDTQATSELAERAWRLPGLSAPEPATLRRLHLLLQVTHSVRAAEVRRTLASYEPLPSGEVWDRLDASPVAHERVAHNLSAGATSFVGRARELRLIAGFLADPACRLLTLTGMGGVGKSRLAMRAGLDQLDGDRYRDGVYFVPLEWASRGDDVPLRIAAAIELDPASDADGWEAVAGFVKDRRVLLILDDLRASTDLAARLSGLLEGAPGLDVLCTSRRRLALEEEQVLTLAGLELPAVETPVEEARYSDAERLFIERALRRRHDLNLAAERPHVREICLQLEGHPLALELAADLVRYLRCENIASEMTSRPEMLGSLNGDSSDGHGSVRAVFDTSWSQLPDKDRGVLRSLSVFRGPFRRGAAKRVAGAGLTSLARLVDRSLVRALPDGRFDLHRLLRRYLEQRAAEAPDEAAQSRREHGRWLLELMEEQAERLRVGRQQEVVRTLEEVWPDFRSAYGWLLENGEPAAVETFLDLMEVSFQVRGAFAEGIEVLNAIEERFAGTREFSRVARRAALERSWYHHRMGQFDDAMAAACRCMAATSRRSDSRLRANAHQALALVEQARGRYPRSRRRLRLALALSRSCDERLTEARILSSLGSTEIVMGNGEAAAACYERSLAINREAGRILNVARDLGNLGAVFGHRGDRSRAIALLAESVSLAKEHGFLQLLPYNLSNLGAEHARDGRFEDALELTSEALVAAERTGQREFRAAILANVVSLLAEVGKTEEAVVRSNEALVLALELGAEQKLSQVLFTRAELEAKREQFDQAAILFEIVKCHPASTGEVVELAAVGLAGLERHLGIERANALGRAAGKLDLVGAANAALDGRLTVRVPRA